MANKSRKQKDAFVFFDGPNGDRRITYEEFCNGLDQIVAFVKEVTQLFKELDTSGDGFLNRDELAVLLNKSGRTYKPDEVTAIMQEADSNGDNKISLDEFLNALT